MQASFAVHSARRIQIAHTPSALDLNTQPDDSQGDCRHKRREDEPRPNIPSARGGALLAYSLVGHTWALGRAAEVCVEFYNRGVHAWLISSERAPEAIPTWLHQRNTVSKCPPRTERGVCEKLTNPWT